MPNQSPRPDAAAPAQRRNIYFASFLSGDLKFPQLTYGNLRAYAEADPIIRESYRFAGHFYRREPVEQIVERMEKPDVVAASCYVWNFRQTTRFCAEVKRRFPSCEIILGGPQVSRKPSFFQEHPYADVLVHGDGEIPFRDYLRERLTARPQLSNVGSISYPVDGKLVSTPPGERLPVELDLPSPYLNGYFDDILEEFRSEGGFGLWVLWETNRGCPYACDYCSWGGPDTKKILRHPMERLVAEMNWFVERKVDSIYVMDANFGLLARDLELADELVRLRERPGALPGGVIFCGSLNWNERVREIYQKLHEVKMAGPVCLAMQSLNRESLEAIHRPIMEVEHHAEARRAYLAAGIPTYTDMILGLPLETLESWRNGICDLLENGDEDDVRVFPLVLLPGAALNSAPNVDRFGLKSISRRINPDTDESWELVIETKSMPFADWCDAYVFNTVVAHAHMGQYTRVVAKYLAQRQGIRLHDLYAKLHRAVLDQPHTVLGEVAVMVREALTTLRSEPDSAFVNGRLKAFLEAQPWDWRRRRGMATHAATWMYVNARLDRFHEELQAFLFGHWPGLKNDAPLADALRFQREVVYTPDYDPATGKAVDFAYDWKRFLETGQLVEGPVRIAFTDVATGRSGEHRFQRGDQEKFLRAALGPPMQYGTPRRFAHQLDRMQVTPKV